MTQQLTVIARSRATSNLEVRVAHLFAFRALTNRAFLGPYYEANSDMPDHDEIIWGRVDE
jgi:hypothetical protein